MRRVRRSSIFSADCLGNDEVSERRDLVELQRVTRSKHGYSERTYVFRRNAHDADELEEVEKQRLGHAFQLKSPVKMFAVSLFVANRGETRNVCLLEGGQLVIQLSRASARGRPPKQPLAAGTTDAVLTPKSFPMSFRGLRRWLQMNKILWDVRYPGAQLFERHALFFCSLDPQFLHASEIVRREVFPEGRRAGKC